MIACVKCYTLELKLGHLSLGTNKMIAYVFDYLSYTLAKYLIHGKLLHERKKSYSYRPLCFIYFFLSKIRQKNPLLDQKNVKVESIPRIKSFKVSNNTSSPQQLATQISLMC